VGETWVILYDQVVSTQTLFEVIVVFVPDDQVSNDGGATNKFQQDSILSGENWDEAWGWGWGFIEMKIEILY